MVKPFLRGRVTTLPLLYTVSMQTSFSEFNMIQHLKKKLQNEPVFIKADPDHTVSCRNSNSPLNFFSNKLAMFHQLKFRNAAEFWHPIRSLLFK
jgi:hypothetical protein